MYTLRCNYQFYKKRTLKRSVNYTNKNILVIDFYFLTTSIWKSIKKTFHSFKDFSNCPFWTLNPLCTNLRTTCCPMFLDSVFIVSWLYMSTALDNHPRHRSSSFLRLRLIDNIVRKQNFGLHVLHFGGQSKE